MLSISFMCQVLSDYDADVAAQEMIVEQLIAPWPDTSSSLPPRQKRPWH